MRRNTAVTQPVLWSSCNGGEPVELSKFWGGIRTRVRESVKNGLKSLLMTTTGLTGTGLAASAIVVAATAFLVVGVLTASSEIAAQSESPRGYFGTFVSEGGGVLILSSGGDDIEIPTSDQTQVRLPLNANATVFDLAEGDRIAVSLTDAGLADKIALIPGKTLFRHIAGTVGAVSDAEITIVLREEDQETVKLNLTPATKIVFRGTATKLVPGSRVVAVAVRDTTSGELVPDAREITVIPPPRERAVAAEPVQTEPPNTAIISGAFEGIDEAGNWIVDGTKVQVRRSTDVVDGLKIGRVVEIEAELTSDGTLVATHIEAKVVDQPVASRLVVVGAFQGINAQGRWIVDGVELLVNRNTDTDGVPAPGQLVEVIAFQRADETVVAREIHNLRARVTDVDGVRTFEAVGTFKGVDDSGRWRVNGVSLHVDESTILEGTPVVGHPVRVRAVRREDGTLLAVSITGILRDTPAVRKTVAIRGVVDRVEDDGSIVVGDVSVKTSDLTEVVGEVQEGARVLIRAQLLEDGSLTATEVVVDAGVGLADTTTTRKVDIEGIVEEIAEDGTLVVNGIMVRQAPDTVVRGDIVEGGLLKIEGTLADDGSVTALQIRGENLRANVSMTEARIEGPIQAIKRDARGRPIGIEVNGTAIDIREVTDVRVRLREGAQVTVVGIISDSRFVARSMRPRPLAHDAVPPTISLSGPIKGIRLDEDGVVSRIIVTGVVVVINAETRVEGVLRIDVPVKLTGVRRGDLLVAIVVRSAEDDTATDQDGDGPAASEPGETKLRGEVEQVFRNRAGLLQALRINGINVRVTADTRVSGIIRPGLDVTVVGVVRRGVVVALTVEGTTALRSDVAVPVRPVENETSTEASSAKDRDE